MTLSLPELEAHLADVSYKDWRFSIAHHPWEGLLLVITVTCEDNFNPGQSIDLGIRSFLPPMRDDEDFNNWLMARIIRMESHEARERFRFKGRAIFDPHAESNA